VADDQNGSQNILDGHLQFAGDAGVILRFQIFEMIEDDPLHKASVTPGQGRLNQQTLAEVPARNAERVEFLDFPNHLFHEGRRNLFLNGNLFRGRGQISVWVQVADDLFADPGFILRKAGQTELPHQVIRERRLCHEEIVP